MADTFSNDLRLRLQESGSNAGTWGDLLNGTITNIASGFGQGSEAIPNASTHTITLADGTADEARSLYLKCTGGGQACTVTLGPNTISKVWIIDNATSYTLTFSQGSGANVAIAAGAVKVIATDGAGSGAAVVDTLDGLEGSLSTLAVTGALTVDTNTLVVDATNNRVGIGITPSVKLEVNGGADGSVVFSGRSDGGNGNNQRFNLIAFSDGGGSGYGGGLKIQTRSSTNVFSDAVTVSSAGDLLVGKTAFDDGATTGFTHYSGGGDSATFSTRSSNPPLNLNRLNSDGEILRIRKDGTTVGSIAVASSNNLAIDGLVASHAGLEFGTGRITPRVAGATADNAVDLGYSTQRFQDLYLSGGAFLGGTAAANKLEDYEEGTHATTVSFSNSGSATVISNTLAYTKIGNAVTVTGYVAFNGISSPNGILRFTLPFPVAAGAHHRSSADLKFNGLSTGYGLNDTPWPIVEDSTSTVAVYGGQSTSVNFVMGAACTASTDFRVSVSYITSA